MYRLIFGILMLTSFSVLSQTQQPNEIHPNAITDAQQCLDFGYMADMYSKKASEGGIYAEKYNLIAQNFRLMHKQCLDSTNEKGAYSGFRSNAQQMQMQQAPKAKK
jgi:hypothetical protein